MQLIVNILSAVVLVSLAMLLLAYAVSVFKKTKIVSSMSIQCSSGDSEVMTFNHNFLEGEDEASKQSKIDESFAYIQARRDDNHKKFMEIRRQAIAENQGKSPEELKLRSVMDAPEGG